LQATPAGQSNGRRRLTGGATAGKGQVQGRALVAVLAL